jgi:hypothetical protein
LVLHTTYVLRVPYSCGVVLVFWFWWEIVFGITYVLSVQYSCVVVSVFLVVVGKLILYEYLTVTIVAQKYRELSL